MRRYLVIAIALLLTFSISFSVGLYSGLRKNFIFEGIVKTVRLLTPDDPVETAPTLNLDMSDRTLLDSTILPLHQREVLVTDANGKPMPLLAIASDGGSEAVILTENGTLFRIDTDSCDSPDCLHQVGRLVRPDGTALDDSYDLLSVDIDGTRQWFVSYGQEDRTGYNKALVISRFTPPKEPGPDPLLRIDEPFFRSTSFTLRNGHSMRSGGGAMAYDPATGDLIVTIGDYSLNGISNVFEGPIPPAQDPDSDLGKILRVNMQTGESRIVSTGHRNPQGLSISPDGEIIATEHGPKGGDELNLIEDGRNYGWPYVSMGTKYGAYTFPQQPIDPGAVHGGYTPPLIAFMPNPGVSALIHIHDFHPAWDGDLMVSSLRARTLLRVRKWDGGDYVEPIYIGDRIRDLDIIGKEMVLLTDSGKIILLNPIDDLEMARSETGLVTNMTALSECGSCHNVNSPTSTADAPYLHGIVGRPIASASDYARYSSALMEKQGSTWDLDSLEKFLRSPQDFAPGTAMPDQDLADEQIAELMGLLPLLR